MFDIDLVYILTPREPMLGELYIIITVISFILIKSVTWRSFVARSKIKMVDLMSLWIWKMFQIK